MPDEFRKAQITGKDDPRTAVKIETQQELKQDTADDLNALQTWEQENINREQENLANIHRNESTAEEPINYTTETPVPEE